MVSQGIAPKYSRSRVTKAGDNIRANTATDEDMKVLENWRASHVHVVNTFQANLRRRTRGTGFLVGQRLKRRVTIIDKLERQAGMNLARMHDIAGCRVIFPNVSALEDFRASFVRSRSLHERVTAERDQFNYITNPKDSGYRGIHDVYKYRSYAKSAEAWSGLLVEVQYRTRAQHAWATAVEIADLLTRSRGKFSEGDTHYQAFFSVCSEIIARTQEKQTSCLKNLTNAELLERFRSCNDETNLLEILDRTNRVSSTLTSNFFKKKLNTILIYPYVREEKGPILQVLSLADSRRALEEYARLEKENADTADVVLVRAEDGNTLMKVFQNYFTDARDFVRFIKDGLAKLERAKPTARKKK